MDELPIRRSSYALGQDLSSMSVAELRSAILELHGEIARIEKELEAKDSTKAAADALFRRKRG